MVSIAAAGDGGIFVLYADGMLNHYTYGVGWAIVNPGIGDVLSIAAAGDGDLVPPRQPYRESLHLRCGLGDRQPGDRRRRVDGRGGDGGIYILHADGTLNHYTFGVGWTAADPGIGDVVSIAATANGSISVV